MNITVGKKATAEAMSIENSRRKPGEDWVAIVQRNGTAVSHHLILRHSLY
jgi:hypothetical protein